MTKAIITGSHLAISGRTELVSGSHSTNVLSLLFSPEWNGLTKQIDFINRHSGISRRVSADENVCTVPWEVLESEGDIDCRLRGINAQGKLVMRTNEENLGTVIFGDDGDAADASDPTADVYAQLAAAVAELQTQAGSNVMHVAFSFGDDNSLSADKTFAQLCEEIENDKNVLRAQGDGRQYHLHEKTEDKLQFYCLSEDNSVFDLNVDSDDNWSLSMKWLVDTETLAQRLDARLSKSQGIAHAGEVLVVGANGTVTTVPLAQLLGQA